MQSQDSSVITLFAKRGVGSTPPTPPAAPIPDPPPRVESPATIVSLPVDQEPKTVHPLRFKRYPRISGYEILGVIGSGGMGIVYKARHRDLNRMVAIKMLRGDALEDEEIRGRFRSEAEAVARLQHPNIIQVFEIGTAEPFGGEGSQGPFIALEYVEGGCLDERTTTPQSPQYSAWMVEKLARAAHAAHQHGVVHRDLKPANVLLTSHGEPKIADFGVAKHVSPEKDDRGHFVTQIGTAIGTPEYMSPEQVWGDEPTGSIDVYSLGVILYELLTARLPFQAATPHETMELVINQEPVSPRLFQPRLPRDLETICLKCLQKNPAKRYATAEALADDLARWQAGKPILARPIGRWERGIRWMRRNPGVSFLAGLVVLVTLAGLLGVTWKWREARNHASAARAAASLAEERNRSERWERYRANIAASENAFQLQNIVLASRTLEAAPQEFRNWEWNFLQGQLDRSIDIFVMQPVPGASCDQSDNGRVVMWRGHERSTSVWDLASRRELIRFPSGAKIERAALFHDGNYLVFSVPGWSVEVWDVYQAKLLMRTPETKGYPMSMELSSDRSRLFVSYDDRVVRVWDVETGELLRTLEGHQSTVGHLQLSPDETLLASVGIGDSSVRLWDTATWALLHTFQADNPDLRAVRFSPDGERLVSMEGFPSFRVHLWDVRKRERIARLGGHTNVVVSCEFNQDGTRILTSSFDQSARTWDGLTGRAIHQFRGHKGHVFRARYCQDGRRIVTASDDRTVRYWDAESGSQLAVLSGHDGELSDAACFDGNIVSVSTDGTSRTWSLEAVERDGRMLGHTSYVYSLSLHPAGKKVASAAWDGTIREWDLETGRELRLLTHCEKKPAVSVVYSPCGRWLASLGRDERVRLWDAETGVQLHAWEVPLDFWKDSQLDFSPCGRYLATGCREMCVRLFDVETRKPAGKLAGHTDHVRDVIFSKDGTWLASCGDMADKSIRIWSFATGEPIAVLTGHENRVYSLFAGPDGTLLASASWDGTVRLWDTKTWSPAGVLRHGSNVHTVTFSPDGTRLASGCADNTIRLWDVPTRQEVGQLRGHADYVHALAFTADGGRLVSGSGDFTLRVWDSRRKTKAEPSSSTR